MKTLRQNGEYQKIVDRYTKGGKTVEKGGIAGVIDSYRGILTGYGLKFLRGLAGYHLYHSCFIILCNINWFRNRIFKFCADG